MGMLVDLDTGARFNWSCHNYGWHCPTLGILFDHALVENAVAKFEYVPSLCIFSNYPTDKVRSSSWIGVSKCQLTIYCFCIMYLVLWWVASLSFCKGLDALFVPREDLIMRDYLISGRYVASPIQESLVDWKLLSC